MADLCTCCFPTTSTIQPDERPVRRSPCARGEPTLECVTLLDPATPDGAEHRSWREAQADLLLDWAARSVLSGDTVGYLTRRGDIDDAQGKPLWIGCRMAHCLGLGSLLGRSPDGDLSERTVHALRSQYRDAARGGWWADASRPGTGRKTAYGHAFVMLAGATCTVAGLAGGRALLDDACQTYATRFWDAEMSMPFESYAADWSDREAYRGGNAAMHSVEAFLAVFDATGDDAWLDRADAVAVRLMGTAEQFDWRVPEHYDERWDVIADYNIDEPRHQFRPFGVTPGHAFEWARLLLTLQATRPHADDLLPKAEALANTAWSDAWDTSIGGFVYTTDFSGTPIVRERFHWVACEAAGAAWALWRATGDSLWADRYATVVGFEQRHLIDPKAPGAWWHELDESNRPSERTWQGAPDAYHALQSMLFPSFGLTPGLARALTELHT